MAEKVEQQAAGTLPYQTKGTFIERCVRGEAELEGVGRAVAEWYHDQNGKDVEEALGMNAQEYMFWRDSTSELAKIVERRRRWHGLGEESYIDRCARGEASVDGIEEAIAAWRASYHADETALDIVDMLGLGGDEYFEALRNPEWLKEWIEHRTEVLKGNDEAAGRSVVEENRATAR